MSGEVQNRPADSSADKIFVRRRGDESYVALVVILEPAQVGLDKNGRTAEMKHRVIVSTLATLALLALGAGGGAQAQQATMT
ncbi:MAG: hypothetical protein WBW74_13110, partial [Xanthobacteraceae bacterium]